MFLSLVEIELLGIAKLLKKSLEAFFSFIILLPIEFLQSFLNIILLCCNLFDTLIIDFVLLRDFILNLLFDLGKLFSNVNLLMALVFVPIFIVTLKADINLAWYTYVGFVNILMFLTLEHLLAL